MTEPDTKRIAVTMAVAAFIGVLALLTVLFSDLLDKQRNPNQVVRRADGETAAIRLQRNKFGHYVASGRINGHAVEFLLDTGATTVSVPENIAHRIGLKPGARQTVSTANGVVAVFHTVLDEVALGPITQYNVQATINPHTQSDEILLGMSFLKRLSFTQSGDSLILNIP